MMRFFVYFLTIVAQFYLGFIKPVSAFAQGEEISSADQSTEEPEIKPSPPPLSFSEEDIQTGIEFVRNSGANKDFKDILFQGALHTQTFATLYMDHGLPVLTSLKEEAEVISLKYQEQWERNLATVYLGSFSANELESIMKNKNLSPYFSKFVNIKRELKLRIEDLSKSLFATAVSEILMALSNKYEGT